jgi:hypothetical protein
MTESTIQEIIEIQSGYTSYVDLQWDLFDDTKNRGRMAQYRPIASHRIAFQKLAHSLNIKDKRCYLLTGAYGTGKSHLCLMFANYMQIPANEDPMPNFFNNYAEANAQEAEALKAKRSSGRYLIALCKWGGKQDFNEIVLSAIEAAIKREDFEDALETPYNQARKKIAEWRAFFQTGDLKGHFYTDFEQALAAYRPGKTVGRFEQDLADFDASALEDFRRIHQEVTTAPFRNDEADLVSILQKTLSSQAFKERFAGLLVLFDEFGWTMEQGNLNPKAFQQFAQFCAEKPNNCAPVVFVGTAHKPLTEYAKGYNSMEFRTASDRIEEIGLDPNGVEDIIGAIVMPKKSSMLWQQSIEPRNQTFNEMVKDCNRLELFQWLTGPKILNKIIRDIYPMHPVATAALLRLIRDLASNNRTVFRFFSENDPASYQDYIAGTPIEINGRLNLYTADRLFDYFSEKLHADNKELRDTVRDYIKNYEASIREQRRIAAGDASKQLLFLDDELIPRILRLMLIYQICQIAVKPENLAFGLYLTNPAEKASLQHRLDELSSKGIIYHLKDQNIYEFKQSAGADIDHLVEAYIRVPGHIPGNIAAELRELVPLNKNELYLEAKDYNQSYGEDKRLERRMVRAIDLGTEQGNQNYFDMLSAEIEQREDCEGIALYAICETTEEIQKARSFCRQNNYNHIIVAIPKQPVPLLDAIFELRALQAIEVSQDAKEFTYQDQAALNARLHGDITRPGAITTLQKLRDKLLNSKEVTWYGKFAQVMPVEENKSYDAANRVMELVYTDYSNKFAHDDFNKLRTNTRPSKNYAFKEAVEKLLNADPITIDNSSAQNRADIRYLQKCLLHNDVLIQVKAAEGAKYYCKIETDSHKFATKLPSLAEMVREIQLLPPDKRIRMSEWMRKYRRSPYGQGPVALAMSLAYLCRLFGDSIRIKPDESALGDLQLTSSETIFDIIEGQYPNAFLSYKQLSNNEKALVIAAYACFEESGSAAVRIHTVTEAYIAIKNWWEQLPPIAHVANLYPKTEYPHTTAFLQVMEKIKIKDAYTFLLDDLPTAFGEDAGIWITPEIVRTIEEHLPREKEALASALSLVETRIMEGVRIMFGVAPEKNTYSDIQEAIRAWYNCLDSQQRDAHEPWQNADSRHLLQHLKSIDALPEIFMAKIPQDYSMKPAGQWMSDRVDEYLRRLIQAKKRIDDNRIKVKPAQVNFTGNYRSESNGHIYFKDHITLMLRHDQQDVKIYLAEGGANPTDPNASRAPVRPGEALEIHDNKLIKIAVQDRNGNWSPLEVLTLFNEHQAYEIRLPKQRYLAEQAEQATILIPTTPETFAATCRSLFALGLKNDILTIEQLREIIQSLLTDFTREQ